MDSLFLPSALRDAKRVLVAGAGGGFDVYAGLPLYLALRREGKAAFLANLTFTYLGGTDARRLAPSLAVVDARTSGEPDYFPERALARFLEEGRGETDVVVYALDKTGVEPARDAYETLARHLDVDAIVLVDGGTDILMRGDEAGLGTPCEDMVSLAAVSALDAIPVRLVMCVGFGIDAFHGVCHAHFLENVAALGKEGGYLGASALLPSMPEVSAYLEAVRHAEALTPARPSIVNGSIASAIEGEFGDHHRSDRTRSGTLFINPLMSLLWAFDLRAVARRSLYLPLLRGTHSIFEVMARIEAFRGTVQHRPRQIIPH
ncbi:MAG: DUF1152 domain-containing protein [Sandaracinaceae bacterium]|nr:DUF1152 domain-containing protein [Sandaracinaceae bacterium]